MDEAELREWIRVMILALMRIEEKIDAWSEEDEDGEEADA